MISPAAEFRRSPRAPVALALFGVTEAGDTLTGELGACLVPLRRGVHLRFENRVYRLPAPLKRGFYWQPLRLERVK